MGVSLPRNCVRIRQMLVFWLVFMAMSWGMGSSKCAFEAIFNFGDSNTDTGGFFAAFPSQKRPYGMTHFKRPTGRQSDGRVVIDFLAQALGLPFLSPYLQSIGSDYRHGANYATSASTVLQPNTSLFVSGTSPFYLGVQLNQMKQFKARVDELSSKGPSNLPAPDIFGKSLYTIYIGQNDFTSNMASLGINGAKQYLPQVVSQIASTIKELYALGGRTFLVLNLAPVGCYPAFIVGFPHGNSDIDEFGCMVSYNNAVQDYNSMLKTTLSQTRKAIPDASLIYVDTHAVLLEFIQHPKSHGVKHVNRACCGYGGGAYNFNPQVLCGNTNAIGGNMVTATACSNPRDYLSWDGFHTTEAANKMVVKAILSGSHFEPHFPLHQLCDLQPIG